MGFKINPYDQCVVSKEIDGKKCTIVWYVDDQKVSHMDTEVVRNILKLIESKFEGELETTIVKNHVYLGMDITFKYEGTVDIRMEEYVREAIQAFGKDIITSANTPAMRTLFEVNKDSKILGSKKHDTYHHIVAKLLHMANICRLDIQLAVSFCALECHAVQIRTGKKCEDF